VSLAHANPKRKQLVALLNILIGSGRRPPAGSKSMSTESPDRQQQKVREFMSLMPLTLAIAGLPDCEPGKHFNEGQMDARTTTIKIAYKLARQIVIEMAK